MHILHMLGGLANASGPTHIVLSQAQHLAEAGCRVSIFYLTGRGRDTVLPSDKRIAARGFPAQALKEWGYSPALRRALDAAMPDVDAVHIHSLWLYLNIAGIRAAHRVGVPVMVAPQGALDDWSLRLRGGTKKLYAALIERPLLNRATRIQAVSAREVQNVRNFGVDTPCAIVPNGIDPDFFAAASGGKAFRQRFGIPDDAPVTLFLGRIHPKKGLDILIDAFGEVVRRHPEARLLVAGGDAGSGYAETMRRRVRSIGAVDKVIFAGEVSGADKLAALNAADCFALPSHSEGLPVAALEAMAAGVPIVITRECNIPEAEEAGAGRVVECSPGAVAAALLDWIDHPDARAAASRRASSLAREQFSWKAISEKLISVYREMAAANE